MTSPCTFVEILQPRRLLTKKQNGHLFDQKSTYLLGAVTSTDHEREHKFIVVRECSFVVLLVVC